MLTDYKFHRITNKDDGTVEAVVRVYEGDMADVFNEDKGITESVYRRFTLLKEYIQSFKKDLGAIRTELNEDLAADKTRTPIARQDNAKIQTI